MCGLVIWVSGLSGSGKSTISKELYHAIKQEIANVVYVDGDGFRDIFDNDKFDKDSRIEVTKRRANLCNLLSQQGIVVVASTISLFDEVYRYNSGLFRHYLSVHIECDIEELITRDQKGLYSGAINGKIKNVVGIDIIYDTPRADITIDNNIKDHAKLKSNQILQYIKDHHIAWVK